MDWWLHILPMEDTHEEQVHIQYQNKIRVVDTHQFETAASNDQDKIMLVRRRLSRIYFLKQFFSYPVTLSLQTLRGLGLFRSMKIFFLTWQQGSVRGKMKNHWKIFLSTGSAKSFTSLFSRTIPKKYGV